MYCLLFRILLGLFLVQLVACGEGTDVTPPIITLNGDSSITIDHKGEYTELGAIAIDEQDGDVTIAIAGSIDSSTIGSYEITYTATDSANNTSSMTRTVTVKDVTPPVISLNGDNTINLQRLDSYIEPGATAIDEVDGVIEVSHTGAVDVNTLGNYTVTYKTMDAAGNASSIERVIIVKPRAFITKWKTDIANAFSDENQIMISTFGSGYDYQVDWGDGTIDENITGDVVHTYAIADTYTITIEGSFPQLYFDFKTYEYNKNNSKTIHHGDGNKLISIEQWGDTKWRSMNQAFANCGNLVGNATDIPDLSDVTDMSYMFFSAYSTNMDISSWDVSNVTNMESMFEGATNFNQDINNWDTSSVSKMKKIFYAAQGFNQNLNKWDVSNVTDMSDVFGNANRFNQDISSWDVSNVTNMSNMFISADSFNSYIGSWDVSNVTNMSNMFLYTDDFNSNIGSWNVSNVTNMSNMFAYAEAFNQYIGSWDVSSVISMYGMFVKASPFNQDISSWDVSNVTQMSNMFYGANSFSQNLSSWDVSNVESMSNMFQGCSVVDFVNSDCWNR